MARIYRMRLIAMLLTPMLLTVGSAIAAPRADQAPSVTVRYDDLDLNNSGDIARLYERLQVAALDVCKSAQGPGHQDVESWIEWDWCVRHATAEAVKAVHNEKLSAYRWERIYGRRLGFSAPR
jgi:UrcA family protein